MLSVPMRRTHLLALAIVAFLATSASLGCGSDDTSSGGTEENAPFSDVGDYDETDAGSEPDPEVIEYPDVAIPPTAVAIETEVVQPFINAGEAAVVECQLIDGNGDVIADPDVTFDIAYGPEGTFLEEMDGRWIGIRVGEGTVRCAAPDLALVDATPGIITIEPGPAHSTSLTVDDTSIAAGGTVTGECAIYDAYGNEIPAANTELIVSPDETTTDVSLLSATFETAGIYELSCRVSGASEVQGVTIEVVPGLPANMNIAKFPNQNVYAVGQVVTITWTVSDQFGNIIEDPSLLHTITPAALIYGTGRYRFDAEGVYMARVSVDGPTYQGVSITRSVQIVVNSIGPSIQCDAPLDGAMLQRTPGTAVTFTGNVADVNGVQSVTVNGAGASLDANGNFSSSVTTDFGINFVEIIARDAFGEENSRTCAFMVAPIYRPEGSYIDEGVMLKLRQPAIDDGNTSDIDSLNDLLDAVVNSPALEQELAAGITAGGTRLYNTCDGGFLETCAQIDYRDINIAGPNDSSLTLVQDGLNAIATIRNIQLQVRVGGKLIGIGYGSTGWIDLSYLRVNLTLDLERRLGRPSASVRSINSITTGSVTHRDFGGLDGFFIGVAIDLFEGTIQGIIEDTIRDFVRDNFDTLLDDVFSSLDIDTLGTSFNVPRLDGSGDLALNFGVRFSSLSVTPSRALFGLGTRFLTTPGHGRQSLGIPLQSTGPYLDPVTTRPVAVSIYTGLLNHALHALWRGGFFDATLTGSSGSSIPAGVTATLQTGLPPVLENLGNDQAQLSLGAMRINLVYPGIFDDGIDIVLGARAETSIQISGTDLAFGNVTITDLAFSTETVSLDAATRSVLEGFLRGLLQSIVDDALNNALPSLPIPGFVLPASVGAYGLPAGQELTIVNPTLQDTLSHYILTGNFGLR